MSEVEELLRKLAGLGWCDHEAGICTGACEILDQIRVLEVLGEVERRSALGELK